MADQQKPTPPVRKPNRPAAGGGGAANGGMKFGRGLMGWFLFIGLVLMMVWLLNNQKRSQIRISESEVYKHLGVIKTVEIDGDELNGTFMVPTNIGTNTAVVDFVCALSPGLSSQWDFHKTLLDSSPGIEVKVENSQGFWIQILAPVLPWVLLIVFLWFVICFGKRLLLPALSEQHPCKP